MHDKDSLDPELSKLFQQQMDAGHTSLTATGEDVVFTRQAIQRIREQERQFRLLKSGISVLSVLTLVLFTLVAAQWLTMGIQSFTRLLTVLLTDWRILSGLTLVILFTGHVLRLRRRT